MTCPKCNGRTGAPVSRVTDKGRRVMRIRRCQGRACGWQFATSEIAAHRHNAKHSLKKCPCGGRMLATGTAQTIDGGARVIRVRYCEKRCGHDFATFEDREAPPADELEDELEDDPAPRALAARAR